MRDGPSALNSAYTDQYKPCPPWGKAKRLSFDIPDMNERRAHLSFFDSPVTASFSFGTATCPYSLARVLSTRYIQR